MKKKVNLYVLSAIILLISILIFVYISKSNQPNSTGPQLKLDTQTQQPAEQKEEALESSPETRKEIHNLDQPDFYFPPTPTPDPQVYACGPGGACNSYQDPVDAQCPVTFNDRYCNNQCSDPSVRCRY